MLIPHYFVMSFPSNECTYIIFTISGLDCLGFVNVQGSSYSVLLILSSTSLNLASLISTSSTSFRLSGILSFLLSYFIASGKFLTPNSFSIHATLSVAFELNCTIYGSSIAFARP